MGNQKNFEILARKALQLRNRVKAFKDDLPEHAPMGVGEQLSLQYNKLLSDTKEIIYKDEAFNNSLDHLLNLDYSYNPAGSSKSGHAVAIWSSSDNTDQIIYQIRSGLPEIGASLSTFIDFYLKA